jgi:hypothetical protein
MKKIMFVVAALVVLSYTTRAQTTLEEYNYVTKGYKVQIESGLDMKKGYLIQDIDKGEISGRSFDLKALYRVKGASKQKAAYMIVYTRKGSASEYICIPQGQSDQEVITKYWNQLYNGSGDHSQRLQIISFILTTLIDWKS